MKKLLFIVILFIYAHSYGGNNPIVGTNGLYLVGDTMYLISADKTDTVRGFWYNNDYYLKFNNTDSTLFLSSDGSARKTNLSSSSSGITHGVDTIYKDSDSIKILNSYGQTYSILDSIGSSSSPTISYYSLASVSAAQDSATNHNFIEGTFYLIPDIGAFTGSFGIFQATTDSTLSPTGTGKFINSVMSTAVDASIDYNLSIDFVTRVKASPDGINTANEVSQSYLGNGIVIAAFPFDNPSIYGNVIGDLTTLDLTGFSGSFRNNRIANNCSISLLNNSGFDDNIIDGGAVIVLNDQSFYSCLIGSNKVLDLSAIASGYTATGKFYTAEGSNFEVSTAELASIDPDGFGACDIGPCQWAGILVIANLSTNDIHEFGGFPTDHSVKVTFDVNPTDVYANPGQILFPANPSLASPKTFSTSDYFIFELDPATSGVRIIQWCIY